MPSWFKKIFKRKLKSYLLDSKFKVVEAFKVNGKTYFMFDDSFQTPMGRAMCSLTIYEEFRQRCTKEYLEKHVRAMEIIFSKNPISIKDAVIINNNLKERLALVPFPDHIYRMASVEYFDETESPYSYNFEYNNKKIEEWKASGGMLDFFCKRLVKDLIHSPTLPDRNAETYFQVSAMVDKLHQTDLQAILSNHK